MVSNARYLWRRIRESKQYARHKFYGDASYRREIELLIIDNAIGRRICLWLTIFPAAGISAFYVLAVAILALNVLAQRGLLSLLLFSHHEFITFFLINSQQEGWRLFSEGRFIASYGAGYVE